MNDESIQRAMIHKLDKQIEADEAKLSVLKSLRQEWSRELFARTHAQHISPLSAQELARAGFATPSSFSGSGPQAQEMPPRRLRSVTHKEEVERAIEQYLRESEEPLTTRQICDLLNAGNFKISFNYTGTILSRGEQFIHKGNLWFLVEQQESVETDEPSTAIENDTAEADTENSGQ